MKKIFLNKIPFDIENGIISKREAVNKICSFINYNYPIFGLEKYDDDFRSNIILDFLEKGELMLSHYDKSQGNFFNYLYCYMLSLTRTRLRILAKQNMAERITVAESINSHEDCEYKYSNINFNLFDAKNVSFSYKPVTQEDLQNTFKNVQGDKKLLVIAIKSAFYINDSQINKICSHYHLREADFYNAIQYCKDLLLKKSDRKIKMQERRNYAYYHHRKYDLHLQKIKESYDNDEIITDRINKKNNKQIVSWNTLNKKFEKGYIILRPTNKTVANILGICERQVAYYINCAKKYFEDNLKDS